MAGTSHLAQVPDIAVLLYFEGEKPSVFQGGCCHAVKLILVLHSAGKPGGALPPLPGRCWYHAWEHAFLVCHVICPSGLCICYPSLCSHCSVYSGLFLVYHMSWLDFVFVWQLRSFWKWVFINRGMFGTTFGSIVNQQTPVVFYTDYGYDFVLFLLCSALCPNILLVQPFL